MFRIVSYVVSFHIMKHRRISDEKLEAINHS